MSGTELKFRHVHLGLGLRFLHPELPTNNHVALRQDLVSRHVNKTPQGKFLWAAGGRILTVRKSDFSDRRSAE